MTNIIVNDDISATSNIFLRNNNDDLLSLKVISDDKMSLLKTKILVINWGIESHDLASSVLKFPFIQIHVHALPLMIIIFYAKRKTLASSRN
jgi:hypothetical protein